MIFVFGMIRDGDVYVAGGGEVGGEAGLNRNGDVFFTVCFGRDARPSIGLLAAAYFLESGRLSIYPFISIKNY